MAILNNLIVNGASRFLNKAYFSFIKADRVEAETGKFHYIEAASGSIDELTSKRVIAEVIDVEKELHTKEWTNANIANIGGIFYVAPTVITKNSSPKIAFSSMTANNVTTYTVVINGTFATNFVKPGKSTSASNWTSGSEILITGTVSNGTVDFPMGTLVGTLSGNHTVSASGTSKTITINNVTDSKGNKDILQEIIDIFSTSQVNWLDGQLSLKTLGQAPVGIMLTSMGLDNKTYMDIYGGLNETGKPNVRIGDLNGITATINGVSKTLEGWGIFTDNGYFEGEITATSGHIGGWNIGTDSSKSLWHGGTGVTIANPTLLLSKGLPISAANAVSNAPANTEWMLKASNQFGVTTAGKLYASGADISGNTVIGGNTSISGNATIAGTVKIGGSKTAATVLSDISDAATKATNYLTVISGTSGISVHSQGDEKNFVNMNSTNGVTIYRNINGTATDVANFGGTARIGQESGSNVLISDSSIQMLKNGIVCSQFNLPTTSAAHLCSAYKTVKLTTLANMLPGNIVAEFHVSGLSRVTTSYFYCRVVREDDHLGGIISNTRQTYDQTDMSTWFWYDIVNDFVNIKINQIKTDDLYSFALSVDADIDNAPCNVGCYADMTDGITFAVGNGTSDNDRSNSMMVDWSGNFITIGMAGIIQMFAGDESAVPVGWLLCDGSEYFVSDYPLLNNILGGDSNNDIGATTWGTPSSTSKFKVPDLRGRAPIGAGTGRNVADTADLTTRTLGTKISDAESVKLNANQSGVPAHAHPLGYDSGYSSVVANTDLGENKVTKGSTTTSEFVYKSSASGDVKRSGKTSTNNNTAAAASAAHENMQPSAVVNFIICTGKTS